MFDDSVDSFKNLTQNFVDFVKAADEYSFMFNVSGIGFQFDYNHEMFQDPTFFTDVTKANLLTKQDSIIDYMKQSGTNFTRIFQIFYAWQTFYSLTNEMYVNKTTIEDIYADYQNTLTRNYNADVSFIGTTIKARDIVCYIAMAYHLAQSTYDYYDLTFMSSARCNISDAQWLTVYNNAKQTRIAALLPVEVQVGASFFQMAQFLKYFDVKEAYVSVAARVERW